MRQPGARRVILPVVRREPPDRGWIAVRTIQTVSVPARDQAKRPEFIEVECDAWKNKAGEIFLDEDVSKALDDIKARHMGLLSSEEIKALRTKLSDNLLEPITQKEFARLLQLGEKTPARWESGRERPSRSMNLLLMAIHEGRISRAWLEENRFSPETRKTKGARTATNFIEFLLSSGYVQKKPLSQEETMKAMIIEYSKTLSKPKALLPALDLIRGKSVSGRQIGEIASFLFGMSKIPENQRDPIIRNLRTEAGEKLV